MCLWKRLLKKGGVKEKIVKEAGDEVGVLRRGMKGWENGRRYWSGGRCVNVLNVIPNAK